MPGCPACGASLRTIRQRDGIFFECADCHGRAITLPQIRRVAGDRYTTSLLRQINANENAAGRGCPFCTRQMRRFTSKEPPLELDACKTCGVVWFDPFEFNAVPETAVESPEAARLRGIEAEATWQLERARAAEPTFSEDEPDESWKTIPALFGFPVESDCPALNRQPLFTWTLGLFIAGISAWAWLDDTRAAVGSFAFIPAQAWRMGGITWVTSFFLHAGILHLVGNLYFLLVFGDNVEDYIGRWRYGLLILGSTLLGNAVHVVFSSQSDVPCIGASGGISGVIVFYALQFPRAKIGHVVRFGFYFRWIQMPAWFALVLWLLMQGFILMLQMRGQSNVAATAHLGGALAGFLLWLRWKAIQEKAVHRLESR
jgi:membrane associated rhomboid family serine protease